MKHLIFTGKTNKIHKNKVQKVQKMCSPVI
uniref:Uncharacterized protein n=1 Tax=Anguilla anguilla TaxID=7936 RepID=A0A0E9QVG2_ANGAN